MAQKTRLVLEALEVEASWDLLLDMSLPITSAAPACCSCASCSSSTGPDTTTSQFDGW